MLRYCALLALLCLPAAADVTIHAGGTDDRFFTGGWIYDFKLPAGTPLPTMRYGDFSYSIPLAPGQYTVSLSFIERIVTAAGAHIFNVAINGTPLLTNFDVFANAGTAAIVKTLSVTVTDQPLLIAFKTVVRNAMVNQIDIFQAPVPPAAHFSQGLLADRPATCAPGDQYFSLDSKELWYCIPGNVWGRIPLEMAGAQPSPLQAIAILHTQVVLFYDSPDPKPCTVEVSESPTYAPLIADVDPALYPGSNLDNAPGSTWTPDHRSVVLGKPGTPRALKPLTKYFARLTCGTSTRTTSFATLSDLTATSKGPDQINLTWPAMPDPGYGYLVEVRSSGDSRYANWTELRPIPMATGYTCDPAQNWMGHGTGCTISDPTGAYIYNPPVNGVPAWVVESQYLDPQDGTPAQFIAAGLRNNTAYQFRIRSYTGANSPSYGPYSAVAGAMTDNYTTRYVSLAGSDDNDGLTLARAWKTIGKVAAAGCGTLVLVSGGDYQQEFAGLYQSCPAGQKLVIQSAYGERARIASNAHPGWGSVVTVNGSGVVLDGLTVAENGQADYVVTMRGSHNALLGVDLGPTIIPSGYGGVAVQGSGNLIYGSYLHDYGSPFVDQNGSGNGGFLITFSNSAAENVIWSNHLTRGGHDSTLVHDGQHNRSLNNVADGGWGMAFETVYPNSSGNLFEGIIAVYAGKLEAGIYKPAFEFSYKENTVRRSVFAHVGKAIEISAYDDTRGNLVYNNVFYDVFRCYFQSVNQGVTAYDGDQVVNNICEFTYDATEIYTRNMTPGAVSFNGFWKIGGTGGESSFNFGPDARGETAYWLPLATLEAQYAPAWQHNVPLTAAPEFVDPARLDFHLKAGSPLLGAGNAVVDPHWGFPGTGKIDLGIHGLRN